MDGSPTRLHLTVMPVCHNCGNQGLYGLTCLFSRWYERHPVNVLFACEWAEPLRVSGSF
jgi:hypothetical protein